MALAWGFVAADEVCRDLSLPQWPQEHRDSLVELQQRTGGARHWVTALERAERVSVDPVEGVPAHCREVGLDGLKRSLPTQTVL